MSTGGTNEEKQVKKLMFEALKAKFPKSSDLIKFLVPLSDLDLVDKLNENEQKQILIGIENNLNISFNNSNNKWEIVVSDFSYGKKNEKKFVGREVSLSDQLPPTKKTLDQLLKMPEYVVRKGQNLTQAQAIEKLSESNIPPGAFLIRYSKSQNAYMVCLKDKENNIKEERLPDANKIPKFIEKLKEEYKKVKTVDLKAQELPSQNPQKVSSTSGTAPTTQTAYLKELVPPARNRPIASNQATTQPKTKNIYAKMVTLTEIKYNAVINSLDNFSLLHVNLKETITAIKNKLEEIMNESISDQQKEEKIAKLIYEEEKFPPGMKLAIMKHAKLEIPSPTPTVTQQPRIDKPDLPPTPPQNPVLSNPPGAQSVTSQSSLYGKIPLNFPFVRETKNKIESLVKSGKYPAHKELLEALIRQIDKTLQDKGIIDKDDLLKAQLKNIVDNYLPREIYNDIVPLSPSNVTVETRKSTLKFSSTLPAPMLTVNSLEGLFKLATEKNQETKLQSLIMSLKVLLNLPERKTKQEIEQLINGVITTMEQPGSKVDSDYKANFKNIFKIPLEAKTIKEIKEITPTLQEHVQLKQSK